MAARRVETLSWVNCTQFSVKIMIVCLGYFYSDSIQFCSKFNTATVIARPYHVHYSNNSFSGSFDVQFPNPIL